MSAPEILSQITGDSPRVRLTDPATSHEAADSISRKAREASAREVLTIIAASALPMTAEAIHEYHEASAFMGLSEHTYSPSRIRTALKQLVDAGQVVATDRREKTKTGRSAQTWALTPRGEAALNERTAA
jgi:predicted ArsR family transcriptional regulator